MRPFRLQRCFAGFATALMCAGAFAQTPAPTDTLQIKRATELRQSPDSKSISMATLAPQTPVTKTSLRVGPWIQVKTANAQTGWVHMFDVGMAGTAQAPAPNAATGALRGLSSFFSGGSQRPVTTATSTVGIRGLGAEDIANAAPDIQALSQVESLRKDANQAKRFATEAPLATRTVENLPEPAAPTRSATPAGNQPPSQEGM